MKKRNTKSPKVPVTCRVPAEVHQRVVEIATRDNRTISQVVDMCVAAGLEAVEQRVIQPAVQGA